mgnify:CR=1 FL=1
MPIKLICMRHQNKKDKDKKEIEIDVEDSEDDKKELGYELAEAFLNFIDFFGFKNPLDIAVRDRI